MNFITNDKTGVSEGFCLIKTCDKKQTARGVPYLDLVLADQSGEISAKLWDYKEEAQGTFAANDLVKVRGRIDVYNGADQLRIDRIRKVVPSDNVQISDYVPSAAYDGAWMLSEIRSLVVAFENTDLKELVTELLDEYEEKLLYWPAAFKLHHAIRGGLLCHTLSIVRLAQGVCHVYPFIDQELLLSGAILHDIAKIEEFTVSSTGIASGYTSQGMLIGHLASGAMAVDRAARRLGTPQETAMLVEHMLLSHHGDPEFGAAVRPMFLEAELLSELDLMDARIYEMAQAVQTTQPNGFSPRQWALENRKLYNHARREVAPRAMLQKPGSGMDHSEG